MKIEKKDIDNYNKAKIISEALASNVINGKKQNDYEIEKWLIENHKAKDMLKMFSGEKELTQLYNEYDEIDVNKIVDFEKFTIKVSNNHSRKSISNTYKLLAGIAAAIAVISFLVYNVEDKSVTIGSTYVSNNNVPILILSDGQSIDLSEYNDTIKIEKNVPVGHNKDILNHSKTIIASNTTSEVVDIKYNTIIIPEKHSFTIILEDSTEVTLNANSELKYPVKFSGSKREVFLKGEAFFDVKKGNKPFIVNSYDVKVKVYGTKFNVNSSNPNIIKTALVKGSVGVSISGNNDEVILEPNQLAITNTDTKTSEVKNIESARYTAWTAGYFRYDSDKLEDILFELSVWYNVTFIYDDIVESYMTGSFVKTSSLESILLSIEDATNVKFTKEKGGEYRINKY